MRILHTADWHLGDRLGRIDRTEDLRRAVERVADYCKSECIDVLLVAGDLFSELARPDGLHDYVLSREVARAVDVPLIDRVKRSRLAHVPRRFQREALPDDERQWRCPDDAEGDLVRLRMVEGADVGEHEQRLDEENDADRRDQQWNAAQPGLRRRDVTAVREP
jgi:hypothetical protein